MLAILAGVDAVKALKLMKPNRNLLQYQKVTRGSPRDASKDVPEKIDDDFLDEDSVYDEHR